MAEVLLSPAKKVSKAKRKRPCDGCRLRKVYCHIEDQPPCLQCQKSEISCTFVERTKKRQHVRRTLIAAASTERILPEEDDGLDTGRENLMPLQTSPLPRPGDMRTPQGLSVAGSIQQQTQQQMMIESHVDPNTLFDFNMMEFDSLSYAALDANPQDVYLDQMYGLSAENAAPSSLVVPPTRQTIASETNEALQINPIDGKDGVHSVYFGLSGEADPYLMRNYKYDENGEYRMFKLVYRQTANDVYDVLSGGSSSQSSPETFNSPGVPHEPAQYRGHGGSSSNTAMPVQFMLASDEIADDAKEDTVIRRGVSPEQLRAELDELVVPEDGTRLTAL
jgi:hypothetical protein